MLKSISFFSFSNANGHISILSSSLNLNVKGFIFITKNLIIIPKKFFLNKSNSFKSISISKNYEFLFAKFLILEYSE